MRGVVGKSSDAGVESGDKVDDDVDNDVDDDNAVDVDDNYAEAGEMDTCRRFPHCVGKKLTQSFHIQYLILVPFIVLVYFVCLVHSSLCILFFRLQRLMIFPRSLSPPLSCESLLIFSFLFCTFSYFVFHPTGSCTRYINRHRK